MPKGPVVDYGEGAGGYKTVGGGAGNISHGERGGGGDNKF